MLKSSVWIKNFTKILAQKQNATYICSIKQTNDIKQSFNRVKRTNHIIIMFPNQIVKIAPEVASQLSASEILQMIADNNNMADDGFSYTAYNDRLQRVSEDTESVIYEEWSIASISPNPNPAGYTEVTLDMVDGYDNSDNE